MNRVAGLADRERAELFQATADSMGMVAAAVEKDFWVCWVLNKIFSHPKLSQQFLFKGGTSLSRCFGLIERFSEDIDLILDWTLVTDEDPYQARSNRKQDKFNKQIEAAAVAYVKNPLYKELSEILAPFDSLQVGAEGKKELLFKYPQAFRSDYIRPEVLIEVSPMSAMVPNKDMEIQCYAAQHFSAQFENPKVTVRTIEARKTFWDKITILHVEAHRPEGKFQPERYSRHYYDIYQMLNSWVKDDAMADLPLLRAVAAFKQKFYPQGWANYQAMVDGQLTLQPQQHTREHLENDYQGMREMIHGEYPDFSTIMDAIAHFELELKEALNS